MKKICNFLIKNRFLVSIISIVVIAIIGYAVNYKTYSLLNWILNTDSNFTLWANLKFFGLILCSYELFLIITNNNKYLSFAASFVIAFSSAVAYNFTKIDSLLFGSLIVIILNKLMLSTSRKNMIINAIIIFFTSIFYSYTFIPYAVSFGYVFLALIIYIVLKSKQLIKNDKFKIIVLVTTSLISILGIVISKFIVSNTYTDELIFRINGFDSMFYYLFNVFLPFKEIENKDLIASIIGLCPIPLLISLYYIYKNEKHIGFLLPLTTICVFEIVFCLSDFPEFIKKILLLNNIGTMRMMAAVQFTNLLLIMYFIGNIKEKLFSIEVAIRVTIFFIILLVFITFPTVFSTRKYLLLFVDEITGLIFLFLNLEESSYRKVFMFFLLLFTLIGGIPAYFA